MEKEIYEDQEFNKILNEKFTSYAFLALEDRALPDARDGLKPSQRRAIYAMDKLGLTSRGSTEKSSKVVGEIMGNYHPHGDMAIYPTLVRMIQDWMLREPLLIGQGNFGSIDGDEPASPRYTECKLSKFGELILEDLSEETVPHVPNYNEKLVEPTVLPSKFPNLLVNGCSGIAVGWATNMPSHNLLEVCNSIIAWIDNNAITVEELVKIMPGPDFATGGKILGQEGILDYYKTGRGSVKLEGIHKITKSTKGIETISVTELPYGASPEKLALQVEALVKEGKINGISDLKNLSSGKGISVQIEVAKGQNAQIVLNNLLKKTCLRESFSINQTVLVDGRVFPDTSLLKLIEVFVGHRVVVLNNKFNAELVKNNDRIHILDGLINVANKIDQTVKLVRESEGTEDAIKKLISAKLVESELQAKAVLAITLNQLTKLEESKLADERTKKLDRIKWLKKTLGNKKDILNIIVEELKEISTKYGSARKTKILKTSKDIADEDLVKDENLVITLTGDGYIKSISVDSYKVQSRGGKGVSGKSDEDTNIFDIFECNSKDYILFFTNKGLVYRRKAWEIPPTTSKMAKGEHISGLLSFAEGEHITNMVGITGKNNGGYLAIVTKKGCIKRVEISEFDTLRNSGLTAIKLVEGDEVAFAIHTTGKDDVFIVTEKGSCVRYNESLINIQGRATKGSRAMKLDFGDAIAKLFSLGHGEKPDLIFITKGGWVKKTNANEYKVFNNKAVKGIYAMKSDAIAKHGIVISAYPVSKGDSLLIMTEKGKVIRMPIDDVRNTARNTGGVRGVSLENEDWVSNVARISKDDVVEKTEEKVLA